MNERIWELSDKCGLAWTLKTPQDIENLEEFAELIVRECAEVARQHNLAAAERSYMIHDAIKEHFGVG